MDRRAKEGSLPSVPRSKGCINCVSRKSRCDGRRPTCRACEGRKQQCRGYRRDEFVFMSDGWRAPGVASHLANGPQRTPRSPGAPGAPGAGTQSRRRGCTEGLGAPQMPPTPRQSPEKDVFPAHEHGQDDNSTSSLVPSRPLTPEPMAIYVSFFLSQFTPDPPRAALAMVQNCRRYLGQLLDRPLLGAKEPHVLRSHPVTAAAEALVMNYFGRLHGSHLLIHESTRTYARALKLLSSKLDEVQSVGLASLEEHECIHLVFSCLFLTLWELAMRPNGTTWQKHARGLASVIEGRGPQGFRSSSSIELITVLRMIVLLESISSKRRTFLSREDWRSFRGSWAGSSASDVQSIIQSAKVVGPKRYIEFIVDELVTISNLTADFAGLRGGDGAATGQDGRCLVNTESALNESLRTLQRLEAVLAHMQAETKMFPSGTPRHRSGPASVALTTSCPSSSNGSTHPSDATVFPDKPLKYNLASLCRTAAMTLRLLMCDLINQQGGADRDRLLHQHRAALMVHAEAVLKAIPYSSRSEIFDVAPMCFVPAFRMAEAVLVRESDALRTELGRESELERCDSMKRLVRCHLDFVASKKIPVKIDV